MFPVQWTREAPNRPDPNENSVIRELRRYLALLDTMVSEDFKRIPRDHGIGMGLRDIERVIQEYERGNTFAPAASVKSLAHRFHTCSEETERVPQVGSLWCSLAYDVLGISMGYSCPPRYGYYWQERDKRDIKFT